MYHSHGLIIAPIPQSHGLKAVLSSLKLRTSLLGAIKKRPLRHNIKIGSKSEKPKKSAHYNVMLSKSLKRQHHKGTSDYLLMAMS